MATVRPPRKGPIHRHCIPENKLGSNGWAKRGASGNEKRATKVVASENDATREDLITVPPQSAANPKTRPPVLAPAAPFVYHACNLRLRAISSPPHLLTKAYAL